MRDAVLFTGYVPFADLPAIYNLAEAFVFPSIYEGFGLPVVEAMACGTPVITGRVAALNEVSGDAAPAWTRSTSRHWAKRCGHGQQPGAARGVSRRGIERAEVFPGSGPPRKPSLSTGWRQPMR